MVKLKWGMEYKGYLVSVDGYMNMQVSAVTFNYVHVPVERLFISLDLCQQSCVCIQKII